MQKSRSDPRPALLLLLLLLLRKKRLPRCRARSSRVERNAPDNKGRPRRRPLRTRRKSPRRLRASAGPSGRSELQTPCPNPPAQRQSAAGGHREKRTKRTAAASKVRHPLLPAALSLCFPAGERRSAFRAKRSRDRRPRCRDCFLRGRLRRREEKAPACRSPIAMKR